MPLRVSICIPAYKARRYIYETLACIRAQTFSDWELIIVEDGSDDGTRQCVAEFARTVTQPIHYLRHEKNQGLPKTRNTGFAAATGQSIAILDADDLWTHDHLTSLIDKQDSTGAGLVFASSQIFESDTGKFGELRDATPALTATAAESLFKGKLIIQPSSALFHASW